MPPNGNAPLSIMTDTINRPIAELIRCWLACKVWDWIKIEADINKSTASTDETATRLDTVRSPCHSEPAQAFLTHSRIDDPIPAASMMSFCESIALVEATAPAAIRLVFFRP